MASDIIETITRRGRALLCAGVLALAACGGTGNSLSGSVSEVYSLDFDGVAATIFDRYLIIEYTRAAEGASAGGKVVKLTVDMTGLIVEPGKEIDLTEAVGQGARGSLQQVLGQTVEFPMATGTLILNQVPAGGGKVSGRFFTRLTNPSGRTLNGEFDAVAKQL